MIDAVMFSGLWYYTAAIIALLSALAIILLWIRRKSLLDLQRFDLHLAAFAKPEPMPSFAGLRPCGLALFRQFDAKAFLSEWLN